MLMIRQIIRNAQATQTRYSRAQQTSRRAPQIAASDSQRRPHRPHKASPLCDSARCQRHRAPEPPSCRPSAPCRQEHAAACHAHQRGFYHGQPACSALPHKHRPVRAVKRMEYHALPLRSAKNSTTIRKLKRINGTRALSNMQRDSPSVRLATLAACCGRPVASRVCSSCAFSGRADKMRPKHRDSAMKPNRQCTRQRPTRREGIDASTSRNGSNDIRPHSAHCVAKGARRMPRVAANILALSGRSRVTKTSIALLSRGCIGEVQVRSVASHIQPRLRHVAMTRASSLGFASMRFNKHLRRSQSTSAASQRSHRTHALRIGASEIGKGLRCGTGHLPSRFPAAMPFVKPQGTIKPPITLWNWKGDDAHCGASSSA
ncbi:hypothetical protein TCSYLVIO_007271 [Trypanosoma cruzi]|nr:hypothetical protein TCSYLVIO_007271 [Trypanosoma cruzi]